MGRPNQSPIAITHFSHPHPLRLTAASYPPSTSPGAHCAGCGFPGASATSYSCSPCGFLLHFTCANLHPLLLHPCHPKHGLALLPCPPYSDGTYTCDACVRAGSGFVYHCAVCGLDLHTTCAMAPAAVSCPAHTQHALALFFTSPYGEGEGFTCDACGQSGAPREWLYRCDECQFDAHLVCSGGVVQAPAVQLSYSRSYRGGVAPVGGGGGGRGRAGGFVGNVVQSITSGLVQGIIGGGVGGGGGGPGFTTGLVQGIMGGGGSGGGGDGGDGGGGSGFGVDMISQATAGGIFGNSESCE